MTTTDTNTVDNGVNVAALLGAREAMTGTPAAAKFTWKVTNEWMNGTHSRIDDPGLLRRRRASGAQDDLHASTPTIRRSSPPRTTG